MAGLKGRLKNLQRQAGGGRRPTATPPSTASLTERLDRLRPRRGQPHRTMNKPVRVDDRQIAELLNGRLIADGLIRIDRTFSLSHRHGRVPLSGMLQPLPTPLCGDIDGDPRRFLLIDSETTGLAGGTGTLCFLVGLGTIEADVLKITLLFITGFQAEQRMLPLLASMVADDAILVSFNGKSFDIPLLTSRFRLARLPDPFYSLPHLDLLHPLRRAFRNRWPDCQLRSAEERLLAFRRKNDLPGAEVPAVWFDLVKHGRTERLRAMVRHNGLDVLSLAALLPALADAYLNPAEHDADILGIARAHDQRDDGDGGFRMLLANRSYLDSAGLLELARRHRRRLEWPAATAIWNHLAADDHPEALERLAKYHEHIEKNPAAALTFTERLIAVEGATAEHVRRWQRLQEHHPAEKRP